MNPDLFNTVEGINEIRRSQAARYASTYQVDWIIELREQWKKYNNALDQEKASVNKLKKELGVQMKMKNQVTKTGTFDSTQLDTLLAEKEKLDSSISKNEVVVEKIRLILDEQMSTLGNIVDISVPVSNDEANNRVEKTWTSDQGLITKPLHHSEVMWRLNAYDMEAASNISGQRTYFLLGPGVLINMALQQYGIDFLRKKGYEPVSTPFFMDAKIMEKTAQLSDYDEQLYKVDCGKEHPSKFLIATSEQCLSARYISGTNSPAFLDKTTLPIRMAGISSCFRKEAGNGKDTRGLFRIHQFEKVEQFCIVAPNDSRDEHQRMLNISEEFYQSLGLSYRVINIVSGALNDAASIKYDLEAWFPHTKEYRELVSCSNCTDYQSRKLDIRYGFKEGQEKTPYVSMLNSTLSATERTMCCLMENYQTDEGFIVPTVLRPYCHNIEKFDFVRELKKN